MIVEQKHGDSVNSYGVSWGHYVEKDMPVETLGTDSLGSCFAFIRIDKDAGKVFFAHVSNDGETETLLNRNFTTSAPLAPSDKEIQFLYVKGSDPSVSTIARIAKLRNKYRGETYHKTDYAGVTLSAFKKADVKIVITHCKKIDASNNDEYKMKTDAAMWWLSDHGLEKM